MKTPTKQRNLYSFFKNNIKGIGDHGVVKTIARLGLLPDFKVEFLPKDQQNSIIAFALNNLKLKDFKNENYFIKNNRLNTLKTLNSFRSQRHNNNMPVRGQRTHTNSKTRRKHNVK